MQISSGIVYLTTMACASAAAMAMNPVQEVVPFRGKVDAADVVGGYASTHVLVQLATGIEPARTAEGALTLARKDRRALNEREGQLAHVLSQWSAHEMTRTTPFAFANKELAREFGLDRYYTIRVPMGTDTRAVAAELREFADLIDRAESDGIGGILQTFPNDPSFNLQYGLHNTGQTIEGQAGIAGADIGATHAWDITTGSEDIIVAIVDTGVASGHPDLSANMMTGYNAIDGSSNTSDSWLISHGTHVAGIAAARGNNGTGITGVSWYSTIMPVKVLNLFGGGTETDIANGVLWAADNGAHVINMSLGVPDGISYFENAVNYAHAQGALVIAASGNTPGAPIGPPARWDNVMAVGSTNNRDQVSSFTTTGPELSISAPGTDVYSTYAALFSGDYTFQSGTSMAAPHVAGAACLVWSMDPSLTNAQVRTILESSADDLGTPGWNPQFGHGRVNVHAAVLAVQPLGNDTCDTAIAVGDGVTDYSNSNATTTGPVEVDHCNFFGDSNVQNDVWFDYTASCDGLVTVSLCGSSYSTKIAVYGASCPAGPGEVIACDTVSCPTSTRSQVTFSAAAGESFKLRVGGHGGAQGNGVMTIGCEPLPTCPSDLNGSGTVDVSDLLILLGAWGNCADVADCPADLNGDGVVDVSDLLILLGDWGPC
jgi:subtilisin family serine protease